MPDSIPTSTLIEALRADVTMLRTHDGNRLWVAELAADRLESLRVDTLKEVMASLKATPIVTLAGRGGAYSHIQDMIDKAEQGV
jgi:hypothetical protein